MINSNVQLGKNVLIYDSTLVSINGCTIGNNSKIHPFVVIQPGVVIGNNCKIQSFVFIPEGVCIDDDVFIGPHVCFTNDKHPRVVAFSGNVKHKPDWKLEKTVIGRGVAIGANATILCGLTIGEHSVIGAGAVVVENVPAQSTVVGNPAKQINET